jgi:hypothetical protein
MTTLPVFYTIDKKGLHISPRKFRARQLKKMKSYRDRTSFFSVDGADICRTDAERFLGDGIISRLCVKPSTSYLPQYFL